MKRYIKKIESCRKKINNVTQEFYNALVEMVKAHGGFIDLQDKSKDKMYGYAIDAQDDLREYNMLALRIDDDGYLCCFLAPKFGYVDVKYTKDDMMSADCDEMWYFLDGTDGYLYSWATLVDMMECIAEYDE